MVSVVLLSHGAILLLGGLFGCYFWNVHHGVFEGCRSERITWYLAEELRRLMVVTYRVQFVHI